MKLLKILNRYDVEQIILEELKRKGDIKEADKNKIYFNWNRENICVYVTLN